MQSLIRTSLFVALLACGSALAADRDHDDDKKEFVPPTVFQAAGPDATSIQGSVDDFRAALGNPNNGNSAGPLAKVAARSTGTAAVRTSIRMSR